VTTLTAATPAAMELQVNGVPHAPGKFLSGKTMARHGAVI